MEEEKLAEINQDLSCKRNFLISLIILSQSHAERGEYKESEQICSRATNLYKTRIDSGHQDFDLLRLQVHISELMYNRGEYAEALRRLESVHRKLTSSLEGSIQKLFALKEIGAFIKLQFLTMKEHWMQLENVWKLVRL
jgi:hypothetical protein